MKKVAPKHQKIQKQKKILGHEHTGRVRHHRHTSYAGLTIVLLLSLLPLFSASRAVASAAAIDPTQPVTSSYGTYAVVAGKIPSSAPTITSVASGRTYTTSDPIVISGSCPTGTLVKIFKNGVLAGSALCQNGTYQLSIDLFIGNNSLIARAYNANDVSSPDSPVVAVQFLPPGTNLNGTSQLNTQGAPAGQFFLTSDVSHRGVTVGQDFTLPITITGGQAPYAISVSWGDGKTDLYSQGDASLLNISHAYGKSAGERGSYVVVVKATDQTGAKSYLQLGAIVSGSTPSAGVIGSVTQGYNKSVVLRAAWQLLGVAAIIVLSFYLGERRELRLLKRKVNRTA